MDERLTKYVDRSDGPNACWPWTRGKVKGYGVLKVGSARDGSQRMVYAHRLVFEAEHGPLARGVCVLHECDNPSCCNPKHLRAGTKGQNNADRHAHGRDAVGDHNGSRRRPERLVRGTAHPLAKLDDRLVREIRARAAGGESQQSIADSIGVHQTTVSDVVRRLFWKHVD